MSYRMVLDCPDSVKENLRDLSRKDRKSKKLWELFSSVVQCVSEKDKRYYSPVRFLTAVRASASNHLFVEKSNGRQCCIRNTCLPLERYATLEDERLVNAFHALTSIVDIPDSLRDLIAGCSFPQLLGVVHSGNTFYVYTQVLLNPRVISFVRSGEVKLKPGVAFVPLSEFTASKGTADAVLYDSFVRLKNPEVSA